MVIDLRDSTPIKTCGECSETENLYDCVVKEEGTGELYREHLCKECLQTAVIFDFLIKAERVIE